MGHSNNCCIAMSHILLGAYAGAARSILVVASISCFYQKKRVESINCHVILREAYVHINTQFTPDDHLIYLVIKVQEL